VTAPDPGFPPLDHFFTDLAMTYGRMGIGRHAAVAPMVDALHDEAGVPSVGLLGTLADGVAGFAVLPIADPDWTATSDLGVHVTGTPASGSLLIDAQVVRAGSRLVVMKATAHDGGDATADELLEELRHAPTETSPRPLVAHALLSFVRMPREKSRARDIRTDEIIGQIAPRTTAPPPDVPLTERIGLRVLPGDRAVVEVDASEYVHNSMGSVTGGIHVVAAEAAALECVPELACTGIDLRFLSPVRVGPMRVTATALRRGPTDALVTVDLADGAGHPVSVGTVSLGRRA
jgi:acyl-coenzyme A thioesterase PaaI-like protein